MRYTVSGIKMQQMDQQLIEHIGIPSLVLMERAALGVTRRLFQNDSCEKCLIVAGHGNNGADGLAVARQLLEKGIYPEIYLCGDMEKATAQFKIQYQILKNLHANFIETLDANHYTVIVDAIFGVGLHRKIEGKYQEIIEYINKQRAKVVAVDIPSGIDAGTGAVLGCAVYADCTVTFGFIKNGLLLYKGADYAGSLYLEDAGFHESLLEEKEADGFYYERSDLLRLLPKRKPWGNKGTFGKLLVVAGGNKMAGAAYLAAKAAYQTGCGMVRVCTGIENREILLSKLPEILLDAWSSEEEAIRQLQEGLDWADVVAFGSGMGNTEETTILLKFLLEQIQVPLLLDADGLNVLARHPKWLEEIRTPVVITPHLKEFSRLNGKTVEQIQGDLMATAKEFAAEKNLVCVAKDARTVVAEMRGAAYINRSGNSGMATAGSGDVLSGIIASFMAQGMDEFQAATLGVWIHGLAGDSAKEEKGAYSMTAEDIAEHIASILKESNEIV